jgi:hypothetical protein
VGATLSWRSTLLGAFYMLATIVGCLNLVLISKAIGKDHDNEFKLRRIMLLAVALPYFISCAFFVAARASIEKKIDADDKFAATPCVIRSDAHVYTPLLKDKNGQETRWLILI